MNDRLTLEDIADIRQLYKDSLFIAMNHKKDKECLYILDEMHQVVSEARRFYWSKQ